MLDKIFEEKFPFAHKYFSTLLENQNKFPQSLIFEGIDNLSQYLFALELARNLNCTGDKTPACTCPNCSWIKNFSHPAVSNVSQIHFKPEGDDTKTTISTKQAREIEKALGLSSDYHRFFIFFSSKECSYEKDELKDFSALGYNSINFSIEPLNFQTLNSSASNALLKSIEEPPEKTTFVFLTNSKENIISTIVSRSQVFKLSSHKTDVDYSDIVPLFADYPNIDYYQALVVSDSILSYLKEKDVPFRVLSDKMISYLKDLMKANLNQPSLCVKIKNDINIINTSNKHSLASMSDKVVVEAMMLKIARGY